MEQENDNKPKCSICHFTLPPDWPSWNSQGDFLCVPCARDLEIIAGSRKPREKGVMTK